MLIRFGPFMIDFLFLKTVKCDEQFEDGDYYYGFHEEVTTPHLFPNNHTLSMEKNKSAFNFEEVSSLKD